MKVVDFGAGQALPIDRFASHGAGSVPLAQGEGESHVYAIHIEAGGLIGPHPAGFDQLFLIVQGAGWVSGADGVRQALASGQGAFIDSGELHAKGSDSGMLALMLQARHYRLKA
ncbi:MAG: hypothetical protein ABW005_04435 [Burkholderiaceae bacterium]